MSLKLFIGTKAFSTWSLRPWLVLKKSGLQFDEKLILLDLPDSKSKLAKLPYSLVPVLQDGDLEIADSIAICEYIAEKSQVNLWPEDQKARAKARMITAQMHSGFKGIRSNWPMNLFYSDKNLFITEPVRKDLKEINDIWTDCLVQSQQNNSKGPFLFGEFSIADAFYAPICTRINTYGPVNFLSDQSKKYIETILSMAEMQEWHKGAQEEQKHYQQ